MDDNQEIINEYVSKMKIVSKEQLEKIGFFDAPASKGHHLAEHGGLAKHSVNVTKWLLKLTDVMEVIWPREESPYIVGMLHDIVKCRCYEFKNCGAEEQIVYARHPYAGHGAASVAIICAELEAILYPAEASAIMHHMGAFGLQGRDLDDFDGALGIFPREIIATHTADMMASRVDEAKD